MNLYEITNKFVELNNNENITEEEYQQIGTELAVLLQEKSSNIVAYVRNNESAIDSIKQEEERLKNIRKIIENKNQRFKDYVKENMERLDLKKIDTELGTISIRNNPISVEIIDEEKIPNKYKRIKQEIVVDKKAIADEFKETGEIIEGINIITDKTSLNIK